MATDNEKKARRGRGRGDMAVFRPILLLAVTVFIDLLGFGIILPNLPQYIEQAVGRNHAHAAFTGTLLAASYSFTQFVFAPLWGRYSDRAGRRPVILISLLGVAAAYTLFGLANGHLWMLFAGRLLAGILSSASIGVAFAYVADVTAPEKRAQGIGLLGACFGLGFMLGPAIGGLVGQFWLPLPAFVAAGMALINFVFTLRYLPESLHPAERAILAHEGAGEGMGHLLARVVRGPAGFLFILTFLVTFGFAAMEQIFSFYLLARTSLGVTPARQPLVTGTILGVAGLVSIFIQGGLIGRIVARFGEGAVARAGILLLLIGFALFPIPSNLYALALGPMMFLFVGRAMVAPALSALVSRKAHLGQGLTLSTSQSFDSLARTVGPLTAGAVFERISPAAPYILSALVMTAASLLAWARRGEMILPPEEEARPTGGSGVERDVVPEHASATGGAH
jgi:MFS family permease